MTPNTDELNTIISDQAQEIRQLRHLLRVSINHDDCEEMSAEDAIQISEQLKKN